MSQQTTSFKSTALAVKDRIKDHNVTVAAAGIAFYGLLALVPTLIALVSVYALLADPSQIEQQVTDVAGSLDDDTRAFVEGQLSDIVGDVEDQDGSSGAGKLFGLGIGIVLALFSASGALQKLINTIAVAYDADDNRPGWKVRLLAYGMTAGAIVGIALLTFAIAIVPVWLDRLNLGAAAAALIQVAQLPVIGVLFAGGLTVLYRYGPDREIKTPWRNVGAVVGTVLFVVFAVLFSVYSNNIGAMPASYGLLGTVAALMIFLQLTSLAVIIGAEVNAFREEHVVQPNQLAASGTEAVPTVAATGPGNEAPTTVQEPLSMGKALIGFIILYVLGRQPK